MTEPLNPKGKIAKRFIIFGILLLCLAFCFGITGALQYVIPGLFKNNLSFEKVRPLHVSAAVFWIIMAAVGSVTAYMHESRETGLYSEKLSKWQFILFVIAIVLILISYLFGIFGGREYWEFHPVLAIPIVIGWVLFLINVFKSIKNYRKLPVYMWMWMTGVLFFLFTYGESYLWLIPYFRSNIVQDMTIQWKSYGSMVGSWNMLIYGCSIYLMDKISGKNEYSHSRIAFLLYFLGLFNLMFNWGHHIYTLPSPRYVQYISYGVSMTELLILGRIIFLWKSSVSTAKKHYHILSYRFLLAADLWVFLTLLLAIGMSVPVINVYTHGTHITVAHTMGATIGINTFLLLAYAFDMLHTQQQKAIRNVTYGYYIANISLFFFWLSLIVAGILKARWQMSDTQVLFSTMMHTLQPYFIAFLFFGITLATGLTMIVIPLLRKHFSNLSNN